MFTKSSSFSYKKPVHHPICLTSRYIPDKRNWLNSTMVHYHLYELWKNILIPAFVHTSKKRIVCFFMILTVAPCPVFYQERKKSWQWGGWTRAASIVQIFDAGWNYGENWLLKRRFGADGWEKKIFLTSVCLKANAVVLIICCGCMFYRIPWKSLLCK